MKLNHISQYAICALVHLARNPGKLIPSNVIASQEKLPELFLLKALKPLVTANVLHSVKGPNGGYRLAYPAKDTTVLAIVEAIDGRIHGADIVEFGEHGKALHRCLPAIANELAEGIRRQLSKITLAELVKQ